MKNVLFLAVLAVSSFEAFAARCGSEAVTRCDVQVTGTTLSECRVIRDDRYDAPTYPGNQYPRYNPSTYTRPWSRVTVGTEAATCEVELEDCKYFAFRQLEKFSYTNNCGDLSVGKSVEYSFKTMNPDGGVASEVTGRMSK